MVYYDWVYRHNYQCGVLVDLIWLLPSKDSKHCKNPSYFREGKHGACVETPDWLALLLGVLNHFPEVFFGHGPLRCRLTSPKVPGLMSVFCLFFCPIWFRWQERFPMPCKRFHWKPCSTEKIRSFKQELWQKSRWKNGRYVFRKVLQVGDVHAMHYDLLCNIQLIPILDRFLVVWVTKFWLLFSVDQSPCYTADGPARFESLSWHSRKKEMITVTWMGEIWVWPENFVFRKKKRKTQNCSFNEEYRC